MTFESHKVTPACLSHLRLGHLACGHTQFTPQDNEHLAQCDGCASVLQRHRSLLAEAPSLPLPAAVLAAARTPVRVKRRFHLVWPGAALVAAAAAASVLVLPRMMETPRTTNVKSAASLVITVLRGNTLIAEEAPLDTFEELQSGDQLRVRVLSSGYRFAHLDLCSADGVCEKLFDGLLPLDGWLPAGIKIGRPPPVVVRLRTGTNAADAGQREPQEFRLRVR